MTFVVEHTISAPVSATGGVTVYSPVITGRIANVVYVPTTGSGVYATGAVITITLERTGIGLWTQTGIDAAKTVSPTQPIHDQLGVLRNPSTGAPATAIGAPIYAASDRVKVVIASGGTSKSGTFRVVIA